MYCKKCGEKLENEVLFCKNCGTKVHETERVVKFCRKCGGKLFYGDEYCSNCGEKIDNILLCDQKLESNGGFHNSGLNTKKTSKKTVNSLNVKYLLLICLFIVLFGPILSKGFGEINESKDERIQMPDNSKSMKGKNYAEVETILKSVGFTNIVFIANEDLVTGWITEDGSVESISVEGKESFSKGEKFNSDASIVITYHTFPGGGSATKKGELISEELRAAITGTYVGVNGSVMVLYENGQADYYWKEWDDAEKENLWRYENGNVIVFIPKMNGIRTNIEVFATIEKDKTGDIVFKSESSKWDEEEYVKVDKNAVSMTKEEYDGLIESFSSKEESLSTKQPEQDKAEKSGEEEEKLTIEAENEKKEDLWCIDEAYDKFAKDFNDRHPDHPIDKSNLHYSYGSLRIYYEGYEIYCHDYTGTEGQYEGKSGRIIDVHGNFSGAARRLSEEDKKIVRAAYNLNDDELKELTNSFANGDSSIKIKGKKYSFIGNDDPQWAVWMISYDSLF